MRRVEIRTRVVFKKHPLIYVKGRRVGKLHCTKCKHNLHRIFHNSLIYSRIVFENNNILQRKSRLYGKARYLHRNQKFPLDSRGLSRTEKSSVYEKPVSQVCFVNSNVFQLNFDYYRFKRYPSR